MRCNRDKALYPERPQLTSYSSLLTGQTWPLQYAGGVEVWQQCVKAGNAASMDIWLIIKVSWRHLSLSCDDDSMKKGLLLPHCQHQRMIQSGWSTSPPGDDLWGRIVWRTTAGSQELAVWHHVWQTCTCRPQQSIRTATLHKQMC